MVSSCGSRVLDGPPAHGWRERRSAKSGKTSWVHEETGVVVKDPATVPTRSTSASHRSEWLHPGLLHAAKLAAVRVSCDEATISSLWEASDNPTCKLWTEMLKIPTVKCTFRRSVPIPPFDTSKPKYTAAVVCGSFAESFGRTLPTSVQLFRSLKQRARTIVLITLSAEACLRRGLEPFVAGRALVTPCPDFESKTRASFPFGAAVTIRDASREGFDPAVGVFAVTEAAVHAAAMTAGLVPVACHSASRLVLDVTALGCIPDPAVRRAISGLRLEARSSWLPRLFGRRKFYPDADDWDFFSLFSVHVLSSDSESIAAKAPLAAACLPGTGELRAPFRGTEWPFAFAGPIVTWLSSSRP